MGLEPHPDAGYPSVRLGSFAIRDDRRNDASDRSSRRVYNRIATGRTATPPNGRRKKGRTRRISFFNGTSESYRTRWLYTDADFASA
ncbi:hypothetical protein Trydic_g19920 [Trypoxylus dichotomus]